MTSLHDRSKTQTNTAHSTTNTNPTATNTNAAATYQQGMFDLPVY